MHNILTENRKIDIGVIKLIDTMTVTTISVSKEFHDWLTNKGNKGESYEDVIKKLIRNEYLREYTSSSGTPILIKKEIPKLVKKQKAAKNPLKLKTYTEVEKHVKLQKPTLTKIVGTEPLTKVRLKPQKPKLPVPKKLIAPKKVVKVSKVDEQLLQLKNERKLELQRLSTEFELAKLANNSARVDELAVRIAKMKRELK